MSRDISNIPRNITANISIEYTHEVIDMDDNYVRNKISYLRTKKGISEYKMSLDLGHSKGYMQGISSGRSMPPLSEFLYMCEYLGVTPKEFFDEHIEEPILVNELHELAKNMSEKDLAVLIEMAKRLSEKADTGSKR